MALPTAQQDPESTNITLNWDPVSVESVEPRYQLIAAQPSDIPPSDEFDPANHSNVYEIAIVSAETSSYVISQSETPQGEYAFGVRAVASRNGTDISSQFNVTTFTVPRTPTYSETVNLVKTGTEQLDETASVSVSLSLIEQPSVQFDERLQKSEDLSTTSRPFARVDSSTSVRDSLETVRTVQADLQTSDRVTDSAITVADQILTTEEQVSVGLRFVQLSQPATDAIPVVSTAEDLSTIIAGPSVRVDERLQKSETLSTLTAASELSVTEDQLTLINTETVTGGVETQIRFRDIRQEVSAFGELIPPETPAIDSIINNRIEFEKQVPTSATFTDTSLSVENPTVNAEPLTTLDDEVAVFDSSQTVAGNDLAVDDENASSIESPAEVSAEAVTAVDEFISVSLRTETVSPRIIEQVPTVSTATERAVAVSGAAVTQRERAAAFGPLTVVGSPAISVSEAADARDSVGVVASPAFAVTDFNEETDSAITLADQITISNEQTAVNPAFAQLSQPVTDAVALLTAREDPATITSPSARVDSVALARDSAETVSSGRIDLRIFNEETGEPTPVVTPALISVTETGIVTENASSSVKSSVVSVQDRAVARVDPDTLGGPATRVGGLIPNLLRLQRTIGGPETAVDAERIFPDFVEASLEDEEVNYVAGDTIPISVELPPDLSRVEEVRVNIHRMGGSAEGIGGKALILDPEDDIIIYRFDKGELTKPGTYLLAFEVRFNEATTRTYPTDGPLTLQALRHGLDEGQADIL